MPIAIINLPMAALTASQKVELARNIVNTAIDVEQMPNEAKARATCWVQFQELAAGNFVCGLEDTTTRFLPLHMTLLIPTGVLNATDKQRYIQRLHLCLDGVADRQVLSSIVLEEIAEGHWGINGAIWRTADFAKHVGYRHLHSLVR